MASFSLLSLQFFLTLPAPFKVALIMLSGFAFTGFRMKAVDHAEIQRVPVRPAPADAAPDLVAPKVAPDAAAAVKVTMNVNGEFTLDGEKIKESEMVKKLKTLAKANPQQKVILEADARAPVQLIANAMKLCKSTGITNVTFTAKAPVSPAGTP